MVSKRFVVNLFILAQFERDALKFEGTLLKFIINNHLHIKCPNMEIVKLKAQIKNLKLEPFNPFWYILYPSFDVSGFEQ